jgi:hypothetical protein
MHTGGAAVGLASALHGPPKFARTRPTFELFELYSPPARHESGLLAFVKRDEAESVVMREAYEMGLELRTAHTVYDPSLVWAHEAAKVAFRLITEARWAAFTCDPCPERLALYNASAAVCRTIRRNEREGW